MMMIAAECQQSALQEVNFMIMLRVLRNMHLTMLTIVYRYVPVY